MRCKGWLALAGTLALALIPGDDVNAQRGGGSVVLASRGGGAGGPGGPGAGHTRAGTAPGAGGRTVSGASHWNAAYNPYGAYVAGSRGVAVGSAGHYTAYRSGAVLRTQGVYV